jgi:hypothetical protein
MLSFLGRLGVRLLRFLPIALIALSSACYATAEPYYGRPYYGERYYRSPPARHYYYAPGPDYRYERRHHGGWRGPREHRWRHDHHHHHW